MQKTPGEVASEAYYTGKGKEPGFIETGIDTLAAGAADALHGGEWLYNKTTRGLKSLFSKAKETFQGIHDKAAEAKAKKTQEALKAQTEREMKVVEDLFKAMEIPEEDAQAMTAGRDDRDKELDDLVRTVRGLRALVEKGDKEAEERLKRKEAELLNLIV